MKILFLVAIQASLFATALVFPASLYADAFIQGTALNVPDQRILILDMPPDGVFNCSSINVGCSAELTFKANDLNTPVYLLSNGDVVIQGRIHVSGTAGEGTRGGTGGPGGFPGGMGGIAGGHPAGGDGAGPGAGRNLPNQSQGVFASTQGVNSRVYGNALLYPLIGGSGGAGKSANGNLSGQAGGGGGGAIQISSNTRIEISTCFDFFNPTGVIFAKGESGAGDSGNRGGAGSGGAIRLVAPVVTGNGTLNASGGLGITGFEPDPVCVGRIRIDCLDDYAYRTLRFLGSFSRGSQLFVSKPNSPRLDVTFAAGKAISIGTEKPIQILLPAGTLSNQLVTLSARNFTNDIPYRVVVTPDTGPSASFDGTIRNVGNPSIGSIDVIIPPGTVSRIDAWTR